MIALSRWSFLFIVVLSACARVLPPEGGAKDELPPKLEKALSTPDRQTNFRPVQVDLFFDEWIQLKEAQKQVVISPPTVTPPKVTVKGKRIEVLFNPDEPWKDSTTYTLFFGKAVSDRSEGNVVPDMKYVFSTGPVLDSLEASGIIIDAKTRQPVADVIIMLHRSTEDSVIVKELPDYFTMSDKNGSYRFSNLRKGTYQLFALDDRNNNYRFDQPEERLAWVDNLITISGLQSALPRLELPQASRKLRVIAIDSTRQQGAISFAFNRTPIHWSDPLESDSLSFFQWTADSLLTIWLQPGTRGGRFIVEGDTLMYPSFTDSLSPVNNLPKLVRQGKQPPELPIQFVCSPPLVLPDSGLIEVFIDSVKLPLGGMSISEKGDTLTLYGVTPSESNVVLRFLPGALKSVTGAVNQDSMAMGYQTGASGDWAMINLTIDSILSTYPILLDLTDAQGKPVLGTIRSAFTTKWVINLPPLLPGSYLLFLSSDTNGNGFWDGADYFRNIPAEPRSVHILPTLRANWEIEHRIVPGW
jgi:uncharacterized protein (DUF2141 family)